MTHLRLTGPDFDQVLREAEAMSLIQPEDRPQFEDEEYPEGMAGYHKEFFEDQRENPDK